MANPPLPAQTIAAALQRVEVELEGIQQRHSGAEILRLRSQILDLVALLERDPGIEAAAGDLYETARAFLGSADEPSPRQSRLLQEALLRLRDRLEIGRPVKQAT